MHNNFRLMSAKCKSFVNYCWWLVFVNKLLYAGLG